MQTIPNPKIAKCAFSGCCAITELSIPNGIRFIGRNAFSNCTLLEKVSIPESTELVKDEAFSNCIKLKSITLYFNTLVSINAFKDSTNVKFIIIRLADSGFPVMIYSTNTACSMIWERF